MNKMSTLKEKAQQVLDEKENKIIPENIKNGIDIFNVIGNYGGYVGTLDLTVGIKFAYSTFINIPSYIINANWEDIVDANHMFKNCFNLQTVPVINTINISDMSGMFADCNNLQTISLLDTSNVDTMGSMFINCFTLQTIPLFNTSKVTNMASMFSCCSNLQTIPLIDTSNVTDMNNMFSACASLQTIPLFNTGKVTNMAVMFSSCNNLQEIPLMDTSNVTDMNNMFNECGMLVSIPRLDMRKVVNVEHMFNNCFILQNLDLYYLNTSILENWGGMLDGVPTDCKIIVKTQAQKDWLLNNVRSDLTNIQVVGITHNVNIDNENIKPISSAYEDDVVKLEPVEEFGKVISFKLNGVLVQGNSFVMPQEDVVITDVVIETYYVIESDHPYKQSMDMVELYSGNISGASKLKVDVEYNLEKNYDYVYINYFDENGSAQKVYDDGTDNIDYRYTDTFYTEDNYIQILMNTDGGTERCGVKVTLTRLDQDGNPID